MVSGCGKPGANPHHLIYKIEKTDIPDYIIYLVPQIDSWLKRIKSQGQKG
jgi:hypothetical protein